MLQVKREPGGVLLLEIPEAERPQLIHDYNEFVTEWNRRERDLSVPVPMCDQSWSWITPLGMPNRPHCCTAFRYKNHEEAKRAHVWIRFDMARGWRAWYPGWDFRRNLIDPAKIRQVWWMKLGAARRRPGEVDRWEELERVLYQTRVGGLP